MRITFRKNRKEVKYTSGSSSYTRSISMQYSSHTDYSPVEDAIPERLPQARLTATVGSSGLVELLESSFSMWKKKFHAITGVVKGNQTALNK